MVQASPAVNFESISIISKDMPSDGKKYRVYKSASEFIVVAASSALEAIRNSKMENIVRIDLESLDKINVMNPAKSAEVLLGIEVPAPAAPVAGVAAAIPPEEVAAPPA